MIIKNKMSAVLAACMFMVIAPSAMSMEDKENNSLEVELKGNEDYKKAIAGIEKIGVDYIADNVNKLINSLQHDFVQLDDKFNIENFNGDGKGALISHISSCMGKCSEALKNLLNKKGDKDSIRLLTSIQSQMSALNMYRLALTNLEVAGLFINARKIDNIIANNASKDGKLYTKYNEMFGEEGAIVDRINKLFVNNDVSKEAISELVTDIVSFLKQVGPEKSIKKQYTYFMKIHELMQSYDKLNGGASRWINDDELKAIKTAFAEIPNNSALAFLLAESVTKNLEDAISNLSQRVINHLNRLKTKLDKEIKLDENLSEHLVVQRNLIEGRVLLVSALNDKLEKAADADVQIVNTSEISSSVASLKSALAMYADTDLLMRQTEEMLGQHYGYLIQDKGIDYKLLAERFIARFSKYFGESEAKTCLSEGNRTKIIEFFKNLCDGEVGDNKVKGSEININNISLILDKISYQSENAEWLKGAAITRMKNHLIKFAKETLYPYSIDNSWQEVQSKSAINSIFNFFSKAGHAIATPVKKMLSQEKQQELLTKKEKKAYEKVKTREEEADKFYASGAYKTKYAKDLLVDSDNILGGKIVLKPYDKPNDGGEYMTRKERDALIKYLESLPESERTEAFAKVKKYTGRAVEVIDGRTDNHLFRRGINHLKSAENRTIPVSYHNYNKGKYSARVRNK